MIFITLQILVLSYAAIADVAIRLIPNAICLACAAIGVLNTVFIEPTQLISSFVVAFLLFIVLAFFHTRGWMGGGDVKLLTALSVGFSPIQIVQLLTATALAGGVLAISRVIMQHLPNPALAPAGSSLLRRVYAVERWRNLRHAPLPYGVAIACGGIWTIIHGV